MGSGRADSPTQQHPTFPPSQATESEHSDQSDEESIGRYRRRREAKSEQGRVWTWVRQIQAVTSFESLDNGIAVEQASEAITSDSTVCGNSHAMELPPQSCMHPSNSWDDTIHFASSDHPGDPSLSIGQVNIMFDRANASPGFSTATARDTQEQQRTLRQDQRQFLLPPQPSSPRSLPLRQHPGPARSIPLPPPPGPPPTMPLPPLPQTSGPIALSQHLGLPPAIPLPPFQGAPISDSEIDEGSPIRPSRTLRRVGNFVRERGTTTVEPTITTTDRAPRHAINDEFG
ncbi:MAG: hypothetical protein Q9219_004604 [cf. Caloplaca sp. 3 TL-2023]